MYDVALEVKEGGFTRLFYGPMPCIGVASPESVKLILRTTGNFEHAACCDCLLVK